MSQISSDTMFIQANSYHGAHPWLCGGKKCQAGGDGLALAWD